jgi:hypothetical protein
MFVACKGGVPVAKWPALDCEACVACVTLAGMMVSRMKSMIQLRSSRFNWLRLCTLTQSVADVVACGKEVESQHGLPILSSIIEIEDWVKLKTISTKIMTNVDPSPFQVTSWWI